MTILDHVVGSPPAKRAWAATEQMPSSKALAAAGFNLSFHAQRRFCAPDTPAKYVYRLTEGIAGAYQLTPEGRRQILHFHSPGDFIGLEASGEYALFVDAITDGRCQVISRDEFNHLLFSDTVASAELWASLAKDIQRGQDHILFLGSPAIVRVAGLIVEMHERLSAHGVVHLPMSRQEMADYLALTIETVSRALTQLRRSKIIALPGSHDLIVLDWQQLGRLAQPSRHKG